MVNEFINYLSNEKRYSPLTVRSYTSDLAQFYTYLKDAYDTDDITFVNHQMVRSWVLLLMKEKMETRSVNRKLSTLKSYFKFLLRQEEVTINPMLKVVAPKNNKRLPVFVEKRNMKNLMENIEFPSTFAGLRDKTMLSLFYNTGMRLAELIELRVDMLDEYNQQVKVMGKRSKERIIPLTPEMVQDLKVYLQARQALTLYDEERVFVNEKGKKMDRTAVYRTVKHYLTLVTTIKKRSPHVLRHSFATHMLNNGADLNAIKELLGHTSLAATQVYTHNSIEKLKNVHKQAHPRG